jgi:two-component system response regulator HydG
LNERILVVDDDAGFSRLLETILQGEGYAVDTAGSTAAAIQLGTRTQYHLIISDLRLPDGDGLRVLGFFRDQSPETPVIMITAFGTIPNAVEAMKLGAADYLTKPLSSPDELRLVVRKALESTTERREREWLREENESRFACGQLVAYDPRMTAVLELARKVAPTNATVLITGESGTGKEVLARCIHRNSPRAQRAFIAVNCAALSPTLIESELFGHEKGAFTGAVTQHIGRFERAHSGTLFLDEIGELDGNLQSKLLRVLQEKTLERVGGTRVISVDVRVIAATNRNVRSLVREGRFREDLFYRLNTFPLELPALRDRPADIVPLARVFLERAAGEMGKPLLRLAPRAVERLISYQWPGNVRELENMIERAVILASDTVDAEHLPIPSDIPTRPLRFRDIERKAIEDALAMHGGNRTRAAEQLGISVRTLQYRLKEYGVSEYAGGAGDPDPA